MARTIRLLFLMVIVSGITSASASGMDLTRQDQLIAGDILGGDMLGAKVAIDGDTAIVGVPRKDVGGSADQGAAYVFVRNGTTWVQQAKLTASDGQAGDQFGASVALEGDVAIVGALFGPGGIHGHEGVVYVFERSGTTWTEQLALSAADATSGDQFSFSVALDTNFIVVGAPGNGNFQGAAYVFNRFFHSWLRGPKLTASNGAEFDAFGRSVAVSGDTAIVGAPAHLGLGATYIFTGTATTWTERATLPAAGTLDFETFGTSVALRDGVALVGAPLENKVFVFTGAGATWTAQTILTPGDGGAEDLFGTSVALSGDLAVVGSRYGPNGLGTGRGEAYLFQRSGTSWSEVTHMEADDGARGDRFGESVAISGVTAIVGAPFHGGSQGSAYVFVDMPPAFSHISDRKTIEDMPLTIDFTLSDPESAPDTLTLSVISSNLALVPQASLTLAGTGTDRTLSIAPAPNQTGSTSITLTSSDGLTSGSQTFLLTVLPASTPPPPASTTYYLAEGATGAFFDTDLLLANPNDTAAPVTITFLKEDGSSVVQTRTLAPLSRTTIRVDDIAGMEAASFSTAVTSTSGLPLMVERTMWWDASHYGAHGEKAVDGAALQWYFAEGSQGFFSTFFLLVNPSSTANTAHVTYFREGAGELLRDYPLPPTSRVTIDAGADPELVNRSFGARVRFDQPGAAERAMYFGRAPLWSGGHDAAGATAPSPTWFLAEGATGSFFVTFVLLANPNASDVTATLTYFPSSGIPVTREHLVPGGQRLTINIADEDPSLASAAVSTRVDATQPLLVERSQYWPQPDWYESHNSFGVTATALHWGLAEGRVGGPAAYQTYILLANPGTEAATVTVRFLRTSGAPLVKTFTVAPTSRFNVAVTGPGSDAPELADEEFGAAIESTQPIAVERALYGDANGVVWAAGTNTTATRLP